MQHLELLKRLGFTEYEARAFLSLAKIGPSTVREIVLDSALPRNKAYEALQRLEQKGYVISLPLSPRRYKISNPELFKRQVQELDKSVVSLIKLIEMPKSQEFKDLFWVMKGRKTLIDRFNVENAKVEKEMLGCSNLNVMLYRNMRTVKEKVKQGAKFKFITPFDKKNIPVYKAWLRTGSKLRIFNEKKFGPLLPRFAIFDLKKARLSVGMPEVEKEEDHITLWTESKAFCVMLRHQFLHMWRCSEPIEKYIKK